MRIGSWLGDVLNSTPAWYWLRVTRLTVTLVLLVGLLVGVVPGSVKGLDAPFSDLDEAGGHRPNIEFLASEGVFEGTECSLGKFCPGEPVPRWVVAVWLVRLLEGGDPAPRVASRFADVDAQLWWSPFVERLADLGVTRGCATTPSARFCPQGSVTREEMASFLVRAFTLPPGDSFGFTDTGDSAHMANINALAASGVTVGCSIDPLLYCPQETTTRAEMATFLVRALDFQSQLEPLGGPPPSLGLDSFYAKYLDAGGLPIVSSSAVPDEALYRARDIIGEMLSDRADLVATMAEGGIRVVVLGESMHRTELPEIAGTASDPGWRGFFQDPLVVTSEENLLCYSTDPHRYGEVLIHELAHAVHFVGIEKRRDRTFSRRVEAAFQKARAAGLWDYTYAATNSVEYWAEGVEIWFGINDPPGPSGNDVNTRMELEEYDPTLAGLVAEVFGEATVSSSCQEKYPSDRSTTLVQGVLTGPEGQPVEGVLIWVWSGKLDGSGLAWTDSSGTFATRVHDGTYNLFVYAAPGGGCAGWYDGDGGISTDREQNTRLTAEGTAIEDLHIRLSASPEDLPTVQC